VCAASVVAATWAAPEDAAFGRALLQLVVVGLPLSVGLFALRTPACRRFGIALVTMGLAWSLTPLAVSSLTVAHALADVGTWLLLPSVFYLLLRPNSQAGVSVVEGPRPIPHDLYQMRNRPDMPNGMAWLLLDVPEHPSGPREVLRRSR
jgi:hypothetical protein